ncbi:DUF21 domain-containing protein At4g14240 [Medicago truncatula]|uniref:DUF21 domain-containing protein At4g14240 n=1 Tax=Medicago truncatula TaxID=3880 RepID=UPI000D2F3A1F|nr:DUF21 domain-containing protein At4g14240 [Medicago truncatula]
MNLINALAVSRILTRDPSVLAHESIPFGSATWIAYAVFCCFIVLFSGLMSGLTIGFLSQKIINLEILKLSGSSSEKKQAEIIIPLVEKSHQLLVTLLLFNALTMEALPIFLYKITNPFLAIIVSVTCVLFIGEIIPQAICSRNGLAVGAYFAWLVRILMIICYPISCPVGKALDYLLGHDKALFGRAQIKTFVSIHGKEAGIGGELTLDETTIINGALDLTQKTVEKAMTPIESTFSLDVNSKLDWEAMGQIIDRGHSRIPVYNENPKNLIGLLLVKDLLRVRSEMETPVSDVCSPSIPRVPSDMPLYEILNQFQKGSSHMAAVIKTKGKGKETLEIIDEEKFDAKKSVGGDSQITTPLLEKMYAKSKNVVIDIDNPSNLPSIDEQTGSQLNAPSENVEHAEVIGIITLEDVLEELLQVEIVDETDEFVDVHKRIPVTTASPMARAPSIRRLNSEKRAVSDLPLHEFYDLIFVSLL